MDNTSRYHVGDRLVLRDLSDTPEGSWLCRETMQFIRAKDGKSIVSITPIEGATLPVGKIPNEFTLVYAGDFSVEKTGGYSQALNHL